MKIRHITLCTMFIAMILAVFLRPVNLNAEETVFEIKVAEAKDQALIDISLLWVTSYTCVKSADRLGEESIKIEFSSRVCEVYQTISSLNPDDYNFSKIRGGWYTNYIGEIDNLKLNFKFPKERKNFAAMTQFRSWDQETFYSDLKQRERTVYRNADFKGHKIHVSEMFLKKSEVEASHGDDPKSELEIAVSFGDTGHYIFIIYGHAGNMIRFAQFPGHKKPAPMSCNGCHYDQSTRTVSENIPDL